MDFPKQHIFTLTGKMYQYQGHCSCGWKSEENLHSKGLVVNQYFDHLKKEKGDG